MKVLSTLITTTNVFKGLSKRGKTTAGWFYGFKLHLIIKDEILAFQLTTGNVSDVATLSQEIFGKLFGDKGYLKGN
jgi:Transposase DDE domain